MKFILILGLITLVAVAAGSLICADCPNKRKGAYLETYAETAEKLLSKLNAEDGANYKNVIINDAYNLGTDGLLFSRDDLGYKSVNSKDAYDAEIEGLAEIIAVDLQDKQRTV